MRKFKQIGGICLGILLIAMIAYSIPQPSNDRNWTPDQATISHIEIHEDQIHIENIRHFKYRSENDYDRNWSTRDFRLSQIQTVDFILSQFADWEGLAHAFLSFGYKSEKGMEYLSISVEIRKEEGESYSPFWGLLKQYELAYVIAEESDVIFLRSNIRKEPLYLFPIQTTPENAQKLFLNMIKHAQKLETEPEFYNTLTSSCMSNIATHVNEIKPGLIPFGFSTIFPGFSDQIAYDLGLIDTSVPLEDLKKEFLRNPLVMNAGDGPDFSLVLRNNKAIQKSNP